MFNYLRHMFNYLRHMFDYLRHMFDYLRHMFNYLRPCSTIYRHRFDHPQPACSRPYTCTRASLVSVNTAASTHRCDPCMRSFLSQINEPYVPILKLRKFECEMPTNIIPTAMTVSQ